MVEYANRDELFLLRPAELVPEGQNQLLRIANDNERLQLLRDVFGSTSNITAMRPILVVEAKEGDRSSRRAMDARIYSFLSDEFNRITIVPAGGKTKSTKVAKTLNEILQTFSSELRAHALLDRDVEESDPADSFIHLLPVSMVENLLVDPLVIWQATTLVHHKLKLGSPDEVATAIDEISAEMEKDEISRRIKARFAPLTFRLKDPVEDADAQIEQFVTNLKALFSPEKINQLRTECTKKVPKAASSAQRYNEQLLANRFPYSSYLPQWCSPPPPPPSTSIPSAPSTAGRRSPWTPRSPASPTSRPRPWPWRSHLDHANYRARLGSMGGGLHAENVLVGCADEDCAIRGWASLPRHRSNMLRGDVSAYGIASASGANGRRYWALELGN